MITPHLPNFCCRGTGADEGQALVLQLCPLLLDSCRIDGDPVDGGFVWGYNYKVVPHT